MTTDKIPPTDDQPHQPDENQDAGSLADHDSIDKTKPNLNDSTVDSLETIAKEIGEANTRPEEITKIDLDESTVESIEEALASDAKEQPVDSPIVQRRSAKPTADSDSESQQGSIDPFGMEARRTKANLDQTVDLDQTLKLDQTVEFQQPSSDDKTVKIDQTVAIEPTAETGESSSDAKKGSQWINTIDSVDEIKEPSEGSTREMNSSMMGENINLTINPRQLSPEEVDLWDSLLSGSGLSSADVPAIDRSLSETRLNIRPRAIATPVDDPDLPSDYRLIRLLGKGGMGNVFLANQQSLDRKIAVKVIKPIDDDKKTQLRSKDKLTDYESDRRHQFLSEAVVTGDLDHPNIVPIYDVAITADNTLFYGMKRVVGTPWSKVIGEKTLDENLDILLKVADAVGFAHSRGVVHRDIKPENIMLGDFGVVMVMDWGLALAKPTFEKIESIAHTAGLGGTPAFMAPEMAIGPVNSIGPASDIYLLGATLFMIITGSPPHQAPNVTECIRAVAKNKIIDVDPEHEGELLNIARKAMATKPADRFANVQGLQDAIREYLSHAESIQLASRAEEDFHRGVLKSEYADLSRAAFGFEEAISLWTGNEPAKEGLQKTRLAHAEAAYQNGDFDLGLSLLDSSQESHQPTIVKLREGLRERESRAGRLKMFRWAAAAMLAFILVGGAIATFLIDNQRRQAIAARQTAEDNAKEAKRQEGIAKKNEAEAVKQTKLAEVNLDRALKGEAAAREKTKIALQKESDAKASEKRAQESKREEERQKIAALDAQKLAEDLKDKAEASEKKAKEQEKIANERSKQVIREKEKVDYEVYLSKIGLAKAHIDQNEFDNARRILDTLRQQRGDENLGWEWRWLSATANQSTAAQLSSSPPIDLAVNRTGTLAIAALEDGSLEVLTLTSNGQIKTQNNLPRPGSMPGTAVAISPDDQAVAVAAANGDIEIWSLSTQRKTRTLRGHEDRVVDLKFASNSRLVSGSNDRTARIWNPQTGNSLAVCWHIAPVKQLAIHQSSNALTLVTAVADSATGRGVVWRVGNDSKNARPRRLGEFLEHDHPVTAIALSSDGNQVATGDTAGNILLWSARSVQKTNIARAIADAAKTVEDGKPKRPPRRSGTASSRLVDRSADFQQTQLVSTSRAQPEFNRLRAHADLIEALQFSENGDRLVSASDDYTMKLWNVSDQSVRKTLRGHGGWVTRSQFLGRSSGKLISISRDRTIRIWNEETYVDPAKLLAITRRQAERRETQPHGDEIWSAQFDASGTKLVTGSRDHTARVLQIDPATLTFREVVKLENEGDESTLQEGSSFRAMSVAIDRVHQRLYVGSADATIRVWDLDLGIEIGQASGTGLNTSIALSGDGRLMLTGSSSPDVKAILWSIDPRQQAMPRRRFPLKGHDQAVTTLALSPDGRFAFTGDRVGLGNVWDTQSGRRVGKSIEDFRGFRINAAQFSPDGLKLYVAADDQQLTVLDLQTRKPLGRMNHPGPVTSLSVSADGKHITTTCEIRSKTRFDAIVNLWNLGSGRKQKLHQVVWSKAKDDTQRGQGKRIHSAKFGPQSNYVAVSLSDTTGANAQVKIFPIGNVGNSKTFQLPSKLGLAQVAMPVSSRKLLTLCGDAAFAWDLQSMNHTKSYRAHAGVTEASFSGDGRFVATASRSVKIWDAVTGKALGKLESPHASLVRAVSFAPEGYGFVTSGDDGYVRAWRWNENEKTFDRIDELFVSTDDKSAASIRAISFLPNGKVFFVGSQGIARVWQIGKPQAVTKFDHPAAATLSCCDASSDGAWLAAGSDNKLAYVWNAVDPSLAPFILDGHSDRIEDITLLLDGSKQPRLFTASRDKSVRVWDPFADKDQRTGREIVALRRHTQGVTAVDAISDGQLLMTAARDGTVILWPATKPPSLADNSSQPESNLFEDLK